MSQHLVPQIKNHHLKQDSTLHVIGVCSNFVRWHSRYRLARDWIKHMLETKNIKLHIVESAFGDRHHELKDLGVESYLELRTRSEIWNKENMINLGVRHLLPKDWKYMAWVDMDVFFRDPNWALETIHQLQHFSVVQPWTDCLDLDFSGRVLKHFRSFGYQHQRRVPKQTHPSQPYEYAHSGFVWACTRHFYEQVKELPDYCILGSADHHTAFACIGEVENSIPRDMAPSYFKRLLDWQHRAIRVTHGEVGFVNGRIEHHWHGNKAKRYYRERWQILIEHKYCPDTDLIYDESGLIQLLNKKPLEQDIRGYNRSRQEDDLA
jgi:hypothetical protein